MDKTSQILFEVTEENLETGLRGYPVGYCTTSSVDAQKGLFYMGRSVVELAHKSPEEVIYLLYYGNDPSPTELEQFKQAMHKRAKCSPKVIEHIRLLPRAGHPMKLFCSALLLLGMLESTGDYRQDCLNIIAKLPEIAATVINYHAGWGGTASSHPEMGYMENFAQMLKVPGASLSHLIRIFRLFNVLHFDHGGGNLSCFVGKAVASGLEDMYGSLASAMAALSGPRHGKANQDCLNFVKEALDAIGPEASIQAAEQFIQKKLDNQELIYGFGHAVLRVEDPRATILYQVVQSQFPDHPLTKMTKLLREAGPSVLSKNPKISNPYPNVDAVSGTALTAAGFPYPEYYTVLFGLSRCVGIARQIVYERDEARHGKGTPIVRPKYIFKPRGSNDV